MRDITMIVAWTVVGFALHGFIVTRKIGRIFRRIKDTPASPVKIAQLEILNEMLPL